MKKCKQAGFTLVEMLITSSIIAIFAVLIVPRVSGVFTSNNQTIAISEVETLIRTAQRYRATTRSYADMTVIVLRANGYLSLLGDNGDGDNVYGLNTSLIQAGNDATLAYAFPNAAQCEPVENLVENSQGVSAAACSSATPAVLTVTIE